MRSVQCKVVRGKKDQRGESEVWGPRTSGLRIGCPLNRDLVDGGPRDRSVRNREESKREARLRLGALRWIKKTTG